MPLRSHHAHFLQSKLRSVAPGLERQARPPALESTPAAVLRAAFAFENHVGTGTEAQPAAAAGKEWVKRSRRESTGGEGGPSCGKDESSRIDSFEAGRRMIGLVGERRRAVGKKRPGSFESPVAQAGGLVEIGLVGDGACLR